METAKCHAHGMEYPWRQDCPRCVASAKELGISVADYYRGIRPTLPERAELAGSLPEPLIQHRATFGTVVGFTADQMLDAIVAERERCARLVEVLARSLDEHTVGGIGDAARTTAKYIRNGAKLRTGES